MSISLFSVAIFALFATVLAIEIYKGAKKGLVHALISLGTNFAAVLSAVLVTPLLSYMMVSLIEKNWLRYLPFYNTYAKLIERFDSARELAVAVVSMAVGLLIFWAVYVLFRSLFKIIFGIAHKMFVKRTHDDVGYCREPQSLFYRKDKLFGGIVGAISAVLLTMVMIAPFMGVLDTVDRAYSIVEVIGDDILTKARIDKNEFRNLRKYKNDICGKTLYELGGKLIYRQITSTTVYDEKVYLLDELDAVHDVAVLFKDTYKVIIEPDGASADDAEKIRELGECIGELTLTRGLLADLLSEGASSWVNGEKYMGVAKPKLHALVSQPFDDMLKVCAETDEQSISYNLRTVFNLYALVIDTDLLHIDFGDFESAFNFVNDTGIIERINEEISHNKYMKHIRLTSVTMAAVAQQLNGSALSEEQYNDLSSGLASAVNSVNGRGYGTHEEKVGALSTYAKDYIQDAGVDVPDSVVEAVAEELLAELPEGDVTAEDIKRVFDKYAE